MMTLTRDQIRSRFDTQDQKHLSTGLLIAERIDLRNQRHHRRAAQWEFALNAARANFDDQSLKFVFGLSNTDIKRLRIQAKRND